MLLLCKWCWYTANRWTASTVWLWSVQASVVISSVAVSRGFVCAPISVSIVSVASFIGNLCKIRQCLLEKIWFIMTS